MALSGMVFVTVGSVSEGLKEIITGAEGRVRSTVSANVTHLLVCGDDNDVIMESEKYQNAFIDDTMHIVTEDFINAAITAYDEGEDPPDEDLFQYNPLPGSNALLEYKVALGKVHDKKELKELIKRHGGTVFSRLSKDGKDVTHFLVEDISEENDKYYERAVDLGIPVIDRELLMSVIDEELQAAEVISSSQREFDQEEENEIDEIYSVRIIKGERFYEVSFIDKPEDFTQMLSRDELIAKVTRRAVQKFDKSFEKSTEKDFSFKYMDLSATEDPVSPKKKKKLARSAKKKRKRSSFSDILKDDRNVKRKLDMSLKL
eukprot:TRINITY_DN6802_c0_g1_i1.p1 TRINITY_DN6802_c0_g1~~TRINITY_DN6802_c0_g1_i1.p1  ORF type:complete len:317 (+),score=100.13 TRINITY_DN6802_c0_g1_i1:31-981(+)